jgi:hypothetical protein
LILQPELGSRFYLKLIIVWRPIAKKYSNGKVKRTLKKGLKVLEMVKRERNTIILIERILLIFFSFKFKKFIY